MKRADYLEKLKQIAEEYNVCCEFKSMSNVLGLAYGPLGKIEINERASIRVIVSTFFHELGHVYCFRNNIYKIYNGDSPKTQRDKRIFRMTAYKAELWVDNWAEKETKRHFPEIHFHRGYGLNPEWEKQWIRDRYSDFFNKIN